MTITITDEQIRLFYPNVLLPAKGEQPISEKMQPYLAAAEEWAVESFLGPEVYQHVLANMADVAHIVLSIIVHEAMRRAIPELDIVLTPNGFGIVSSSSIAPASKERVERLIAQALDNRDLAIEALLRQLPRVDEWLGTPQWGFFAATVFPNLDVCRIIGIKTRLFDTYLELRSKIIVIENRLAVQFLSHELLNAIHAENLHGLSSMVAQRRHVAYLLRAYIAEMLRGSAPDILPIVDLVDFIRDHTDAFPEWANSETALLFSPPVFQNDKNSSGYFF